MLRILLLLTALFASLTAATPTTTVSTAADSATVSPLTFTITFNQQVQGLLATSLVVTNGTVSNLQAVTAGTLSAQWVATVVPAGQGAVTLQVPAGAAQNSLLEGNQLSNIATITYDTAPIATITVPAASTSSITFRITFDQAWSVVNASLLTVRGASITSQSTVAGSPFPTYDVVVAPYAFGAVTIDAGAGMFADVGNTPSPAASGSATVGPASTGSEAQVTSLRFVSATDRSYVTGEAIDLDVVFSRPVTVLGPVAGNPVLALNAVGSATAASATYQSTTSNSLRLRYTVLSGNYTPTLDATSTTALTVGNQGGIIGDDGFLAKLTLPAPGATGSLRASGAIGVNFVSPKPSVHDAAGPDDTKSCGAGSGVALMGGLGALLMFGLRRRHLTR